MWVQSWISCQHHDVARRCSWSKSIKYPFLWVLMSHKIARLYVHNNSVYWGSVTIVWLHLDGRLTGSFCSFSFQLHRLWKIWDCTAAVFFLDHSRFLLQERGLWEALWATGIIHRIHLPYSWHADCALPRNTLWELIYPKNELGTYFSKQPLSGISNVCDSLVFLCKLDWVMSDSLDNKNLPTGSIGFLYLAVKGNKYFPSAPVSVKCYKN